MNPPQNVVDEAVRYARISDCQKSKRGVVIFDRSGEVVAHGFNGQPEGFNCSGSAKCRSSCSTIAIHAEIRALRRILMSESKNIGPVDMLHVKVVDGELVAGGGPSCVQCSKEILDSGVVTRVWLFEEVRCLKQLCRKHSYDDKSYLPPLWKCYDVVEFHELSLKAHNMFEDV